jgi:hypothetical protein
MGKPHCSSVNILQTFPARGSSGTAKARQCEKIRAIRSALVAAGFITVSAQAQVLGLSRSTTWKVLRADQKNTGLSASTVKRMLGSTILPQVARAAIEDYMHEKLLGAYGHAPARLKMFRKQLGLPCAPCHSESRRENEED